ncbi:NAD-dependent epimerase/dehydratase family protein [Paenibacillus sp. BR1-192]|uniref:NAD-dependent epimerase/dehydratase family protein n=1 Tax=Paenibacillus sp. BR1-192 TaxID=3032287 RepID=UPI00240D98E9|nr:NAD-dependent epimerase/dehydratase family protein [Paenibacillus sp. BR1-192]WFB58119.1 NAD-dependent epimerase/dehydratase family protein [Paenibacillus sp. BR1-192]
MKRAIVTGGAGFIGSNIVDSLLDNGYEVTIVDNLATGNLNNINSKATFFNVDICDYAKLNEVFLSCSPQIVIHHAAQVSVYESLQHPIEDAKTNIIGTVNVLELSIKYNVNKVIYASSAAVYGSPRYLSIDEDHPISPVSFYGISKYTPEKYIRTYSDLYGLKYTIFRYANVYGPRQDPKGEGGVISIFLDKLIDNKTPFIYGGEQTRDFIYVDDIVRANLLAINRGDNKTINIGTNSETSILELYQLIASLIGTKLKPICKDYREGDILRSSLSNKSAYELLGWTPRFSLEEGLRSTLGYYQKEFKNTCEY